MEKWHLGATLGLVLFCAGYFFVSKSGGSLCGPICPNAGTQYWQSYCSGITYRHNVSDGYADYCIGFVKKPSVCYDKDTAGRVEQTDCEMPISDSDFRNVFTVQGFVGNAYFGSQDVYYVQSETTAYLVTQPIFKKTEYGQQIVGGNAYQISEADMESFTTVTGVYGLNEPFAKDKTHVYYKGKIVPEIDADSFSVGCDHGGPCVYFDNRGNRYDLAGNKLP